MRFAIYQDSHVGGRASNQDRMGYCFTREALLLLLADGMGGHQNGEIAAALTLQTMGALFRERATPDITDPPGMLDELIYAAHQSLLGYRATHRLPDTPRTTIVACLVQHGQAWWAHCGDSRLYWLRGGRILSRTVDHSHIERLVALGRVSPHERANHPERNKLYNCVGAPTLPQIDKAAPVRLQSGDQLLLCSDGLWSCVREHELAYRLSVAPLEQSVPELVRQAAQVGGKTGDNVTALAVTWLDDLHDPGESPLMTDALPHDRVITNIHPSGF
jgi:protein phosphatase